MDRNRLQELIQADLDGELSHAERAELARALLQDHDARRLQQEFRRTDQLLRDIPSAEAPPGLRAEVLVARGLLTHPGENGLRRYSQPFYRVAAVVLVGVLVVGVSELLRDSNSPTPNLQGSMSAGAVQAGTTTGYSGGCATDSRKPYYVGFTFTEKRGEAAGLADTRRSIHFQTDGVLISAPPEGRVVPYDAVKGLTFKPSDSGDVGSLELRLAVEGNHLAVYQILDVPVSCWNASRQALDHWKPQGKVSDPN